MATVYNFDEREAMIKEARAMLAQLLRIHKTIERHRDELIETEASEEPWAQIELATQAMLTDLDYIRDRIVEILGTDLNFTYENEIYPVSTRDFSTIAVDVDNGASRGKLTSDGGTPFEVFDVADVVEISNAENPLHNGNYTVYSISTPNENEIVFTTVLPSTDNAADTQMHIRLVSR